MRSRRRRREKDELNSFPSRRPRIFLLLSLASSTQFFFPRVKELSISPIVLTSAIIALRSELAYLRERRKEGKIRQLVHFPPLLSSLPTSPQDEEASNSRHIHARHHKVDLILLEVSDLDAWTGRLRSRHDRKGRRGKEGGEEERRLSRGRRGLNELVLRDFRR